MTILNLVRPDLKALPPGAHYAGGEGIAHRLHMNELPWSVLSSERTRLNQYPDADMEMRLQECLARLYGVTSEHLFLTRGSDEGIDLLMRLFLRPGVDSILQCPPTFSMYAFFANLQQGGTINCPLSEENGFNLSIEQIEAKWQPDCKLIMICRPNNPTGTLVDLQLITDLCTAFKNRSVIVVDEAYIEFANAMSAASLINQFDNLIVLRTLSKACGLAGLRLGCILSQPRIIQTFGAISSPFRLSCTVIEIALRALLENVYFKQAIDRIVFEREKLKTALENSPWINRVYSSFANFLFVKTVHAQALFQYFEQYGIAIRRFADTPYLRISIGNEQQNELLLKLLNSWRAI